MPNKLQIEDFDLYPIERTIVGSNVIPDKPGMYAWFINFDKFKNINTKEDFERNINLLDNLIAKDSLRGSVKSFFRRYNIEMNEERLFISRFITEDIDDTKTVGDKLSKLSLNQCKDILEQLAKFSILVSPLYVGIASSLQKRFNQHKRDFEKTYEQIENDDDYDSIFLIAEKKFGGRAAIRGFKWEYLIFACVNMDVSRSSIQEQEFLINRFYNPILGRK